MKVIVHLIGSNDSFAPAETLEYDGVKRVAVEGENLTAMLVLHRHKGNVGIPVMRVHHYEESEK